MTPQPPLTPLDTLDLRLQELGHAVLDADALARLADVTAADTARLQAFWADLPPDEHLRDGGRYRRRRHGCFTVQANQVQACGPRPHWQPVEYNALHGGIERWFAPLAPAFAGDVAFARLLKALAGRASALRGDRRWFVEAHPFRIDTAGGIGRPTPEGAHRDGVDLVVVVLVGRTGVKGGETRVFDAHGPQGHRFTLSEPWSALLLDDARVIHETTPIQPLVPGQSGWRDTLVLTFRAGGFQSAAG